MNMPLSRDAKRYLTVLIDAWIEANDVQAELGLSKKRARAAMLELLESGLARFAVNGDPADPKATFTLHLAGRDYDLPAEAARP